MRVLIVLLACLAASAHATRPFQAQITCPVGGEQFTANLIGSGHAFARGLDLRPIGDGPAPWPIAQCPTNGLVLYKNKFSERELEKLQVLVPSADYQALRVPHTQYYLAAWLQRHLGESPALIASTLLQATWQANAQQYSSYALAALEQYKLVLSQAELSPKARLRDSLIAGELERRLARYDDAQTRFTKLKQELQPDAPELLVIDLQLKLIAERNSAPHAIPARKKPSSATPGSAQPLRDGAAPVQPTPPPGRAG